MIVGGTPLLLGRQNLSKDMVIVGSFTEVQSESRNYVASISYNRTETDPTLDSWDPNCNNEVNCILQHEDYLYIGGKFTSVNGNSNARLIAALDISLDNVTLASWYPYPNSYVNTIIEDNGYIIIGGYFTAVNNGAYDRELVAIFLPANSSDAPTDYRVRFLAAAAGIGIDRYVTTICDTGTHYIIGGRFNSLIESNTAGDHAYAMGIIATDNASTTTYPQIFEIDFALPSYWRQYHLNDIESLGSRIAAGGSFPFVSRGLSAGAAYFTGTSTLVNDYKAYFNKSVRMADRDSLGNNYFVGDFSIVRDGSSTEIYTRNRVAKTNLSFQVDTSWSPDVGGISDSVLCLRIINDEIFIGGDFSTVDATSRTSCACFKTYGTLLGWNPLDDEGVDGEVYWIEEKDAGSNSFLLLGCDVTSIATVHTGLAAVTADSSGDYGNLGDPMIKLMYGGSSSPIVRHIVYANYRYYVFGSFQDFYNDGTRYIRSRAACLNINHDATLTVENWAPNFNSVVYQAYDTGIGKIICVGNFTSVNGSVRNYVAAIDDSYTSVTPTLYSWNPNLNNTVLCVTIMESKVIIGGLFTEAEGSTRRYLAIYDVPPTPYDISPYLQSDNHGHDNWVRYIFKADSLRIYTCGDFGAVDTFEVANFVSFDQGITSDDPLILEDFSVNSEVYTLLANDPDNDDIVFLGGAFTSVMGSTRTRAAAIEIGTPSTLHNWNPSASSYVYKLKFTHNSIIMTGIFPSIDGDDRDGLAAVDKDYTASSPELYNFAANYDMSPVNSIIFDFTILP